ncbi:MAG TPA: integrase core domain-containing protein [Acidimicrobiales bacterium]|nr:integrase core domain-containing protein [Acidimicrobiales bacterium]
MRAVLSDDGPKGISNDFRGVARAKGIDHVRIPSRAPHHNAVVERFQGTVLNECWRPAFHRRSVHSVQQRRAEADAWILTYN